MASRITKKRWANCFADRSAKDIIAMLLDECTNNKARIEPSTSIHAIDKNAVDEFVIQTSQGEVTATSLVIGHRRAAHSKNGRHRFRL